jgi:hypothetical protein
MVERLSPVSLVSALSYTIVGQISETVLFQKCPNRSAEKKVAAQTASSQCCSERLPPLDNAPQNHPNRRFASVQEN